MMQIPEDGWGLDGSGTSGGLLSGATPLADNSFAAPDEGWGSDDADDPIGAADMVRERASAVLRRQRSINAFNRGLDELSTTIAESADWGGGLERFDRTVEELHRKHAGDLRNPEDRDAFARHAGEFAAMQRIGLKRALVERQAAEALTQLDEQLGYYAGKAAGSENDVFRQIATDSGLQAIDELREAGYLTAEGAEARKAAFLGQVDGADVERLAAADPMEALGALDGGLFERLDPEIREKLRAQIAAMLTGGSPPELAPVSDAAAAPEPAVRDDGARPAEAEHDTLHGVGAGDGEIPELKPVGELTGEQVEQLEKGLDALLLAASLFPAGKAAKAIRDAVQAIRGLTKSRNNTKPTKQLETERPKLPTGGIKHVDPSANLATGRYAADKVLRDRGDVQDAMYRPDVGSITFNYGKPGNPRKEFDGGSGLSHIEAKHGAEVARELVPQVIAQGRLQRIHGRGDARRAEIVNGDGLVSLSLFRDGKRETWVITGFEKFK